VKGSKGRPGERFAATLALSLPATASQTVEVKVETNPEREWNLTNLRRLRCSVLRVPLLCSLPRGVLGLREQVVGRCQVSVQRLGALRQCVACWQSVTRDHLGEKREGRAAHMRAAGGDGGSGGSRATEDHRFVVGPASWMADQRVPPSGMFLERQSAAISRSPVRRHREPSSEQGLSDPRGLHRYGSSGLAPQHAPASEGAVESAQLPCHGGEPRRMTPPDQAGGLTQGRQASNSSPVYRRAGTATYSVADDGMGAHCPQPYGGSKRSFSQNV